MHNIQQQGDRYRNHAQVWLLLPWYINGTLPTEEKQLIAEHAAVCLVCRKELDLQSSLRDAVKDHELDELRISTSFDRLLAKLRVEDAGLQLPAQDSPSRSAGPSGSVVAGLQRWLQHRFAPGALAALALSVLAVAMILPGFTDRLLSGNNSFRTLSDGRPETAVAADLRLIFADGVTQSEREAILAGASLRIVSGPDQRGLYFVDAADGVTADALAAILAQLRSDERILFAEFAIGSPNGPASGEQ